MVELDKPTRNGQNILISKNSKPHAESLLRQQLPQELQNSGAVAQAPSGVTPVKSVSPTYVLVVGA